MSLRRSVVKRSADIGSGRSSMAALANEREFLQQSIDDLERELASGDVDAADYAVLFARYSDRLHGVEGAVADLEDRPESAPSPVGGAAQMRPERDLEVSAGRRVRRRLGSRRVRSVVGIGAAACFVVAASLLAASLAGVRLPGESASGSVTLSTAQQEQETLDRAAILGSEGQVAEAVELYNQVLQTDPNQPDALAYGGWLIRLAGLSSKNQVVLARGDAEVARAVKVAPGYPDGHVLLGVIEFKDFANPRAASVQFKDALKAGASMNLLSSVAPVAVKAFAAAKEPLPPRYAAALKAAAAAASASAGSTGTTRGSG